MNYYEGKALHMIISSEIIASALETKTLGRNIIVLEETDSTNSYAKRLAAEGAPHGTVVIAEGQTGGRGRLGRSFSSPKGTGLYMSVILRSVADIALVPMITPAAAVAAAEAVRKISGADVRIKWVNDLYLCGRKICGILTEASIKGGGAVDYAVIGIGVNVLGSDKALGEGLESIATTIEHETGQKYSRSALCAEILSSLERVLEGLQARSFLEDYRRLELLTGNMITACPSDKTLTGRAVGIDDNAGLIIELEDGSVRTINTGEANLCRIKKD